MPSAKERAGGVRKGLSEEIKFQLRPRPVKAEGTAPRKALGLKEACRGGDMKEVGEEGG